MFLCCCSVGEYPTLSVDLGVTAVLILFSVVVLSCAACVVWRATAKQPRQQQQQEQLQQLQRLQQQAVERELEQRMRLVSGRVVELGVVKRLTG